MMSQRAQRSAIYSFLFFSGSTALIYEVLWTRLLRLSFGNSVFAVTTVLAVFMGGFSLGSALLGRFADRHRNPLRLYGYLEVAIGLYCLAAPALLNLSRTSYLALYPHFSGSLLERTLAQAAFSAICILPPTVLMGGTLPAVIKGIFPHDGDSTRTVAFTYGVNILGATVGALVVGYFLIPSVGILTTNVSAAVINLIIGLSCIVLFRVPPSEEPTSEEVSVEKDLSMEIPVGRGLKTLLKWSFALTGAAAMAYQIIWYRSLSLVIGSSTYAFSTILATYLCGLGLGSLLFGTMRRNNPFLFASLQAGIGITAWILMPLFNFLPHVFLEVFRDYEGAYSHVIAGQFTITFIIVLLPTTLMGMAFPSLVGLLAKNKAEAGSMVGRLFAYNTLGAVTGTVLTGFFLIPKLGAQQALQCWIIVNFLIAASILTADLPNRRPFIIPAFALVFFLVFLTPNWDRYMMISGVGANPFYYLEVGERGQDNPFETDRQILYFREGSSSTVAVTRSTDGTKTLLINGKADASTSVVDTDTQVKLGLIPMAVHPDPGRVAVIGLGSGITAGIVSLFDGVEEITLLEIEPAVVESARFFKEENFGILDDPRSKLHIDDARSYLEGSGELFDIIISEPSNPWVTGIADLYTVEFFARVREGLLPEGIFCQWIHGYSLSPIEMRNIIRTFAAVFPAADLFKSGRGDYLLLGRKAGSLYRTLDSMRNVLESNPRIIEAFKDYRDLPLEAIFASFRLGPGDIELFAGEGPLLTDDRNSLEFSAPMTLYTQEGAVVENEILSLQRSPLPSFFRDVDRSTSEMFIHLGEYLIWRGRPEEAARQLTKAPSLMPEKVPQVPPLPADGISETFEEKDHIPLIPWAGPFKPNPEDSEDLAQWVAYITYLTRTSGIVEGGGAGGSRSLALSSFGRTSYTVGYFLPLITEKNSSYEVRIWIRSDLSEKSATGLGLIEYSTDQFPGTQPTPDFNRAHLVSVREGISIRGTREGKEVSLNFHTSGRTEMVYLVFYREGPPDPGKVVFDNIVVTKSTS